VNKIELIKKAVELYLGSLFVASIDIIEDPQVAGTYAIRANMVYTTCPSDFLLIWKDIENLEQKVEFNPENIQHYLQEVDFETWPPKSGELKFI
jgi:hypothetical protein